MRLFSPCALVLQIQHLTAVEDFSLYLLLHMIYLLIGGKEGTMVSIR
jgi:hypothetical protein